MISKRTMLRIEIILVSQNANREEKEEKEARWGECAKNEIILSYVIIYGGTAVSFANKGIITQSSHMIYDLYEFLGPVLLLDKLLIELLSISCWNGLVTSAIERNEWAKFSTFFLLLDFRIFIIQFVSITDNNKCLN